MRTSDEWPVAEAGRIMAASEDLNNAVQVYAEQSEITIANLLGFGQDGEVWRTSRQTALKVLERDQAYQNERDAYQLLSDAGINQIGIFAVPELRNFDDELKIVEIGIVSPPYLLDFGKAYVHRPSPYTAEQIAENTARCRELLDADD